MLQRDSQKWGWLVLHGLYFSSLFSIFQTYSKHAMRQWLVFVSFLNKWMLNLLKCNRETMHFDNISFHCWFFLLHTLLLVPLSRFEPTTMCVFLAHAPHSFWSKSLAWILLFSWLDWAHVPGYVLNFLGFISCFLLALSHFYCLDKTTTCHSPLFWIHTSRISSLRLLYPYSPRSSMQKSNVFSS